MLDSFNSKQKIIIIFLTILIILGIVYFIFINLDNKSQIDLEQDILVHNNNLDSQEKIEESFIVIHITGSVKTPGIVKLKEGSRIEDAITAAGGLTEDADISKVNLAYILEDGIKLKIPSSLDMEKLEEKEILTNDIEEEIIEDNQTNLKDNDSRNININKASQLDFEELPGIGPSLAKKIIEYREQIGNFKNIEDIKNVSGIGDSKFEEIKSYIRVR